MRTTTLILAVVLLTGCATTPDTVTEFYKKGGTQDAMDTAMAKCKMQAQMLPNDMPMQDQNSIGGMTGLGNTMGYIAADEAREKSFITNCMRAQGWKSRQVPRS
jgi:hypothetical protein